MFLKSDKSGFTLVEFLVAAALFLVVVTVASGGFIQALRTQRNLVALMAVNDNASLSLEQMAREMRTGFGFSAADNGGRIDFTNAAGIPVVYELDSEGGVVRNSQKITADNVRVKNLKFILRDCPPRVLPLSCPRRITVSLNAVSEKYDLENFAVNLQTTVSARLFKPGE